MADYYPLLVRAIDGLAHNTVEARKAVYDRARAALLRQLRGVNPPLPEGEITRERLLLEEAIRRAEADFIQQAPAELPPPEPEPEEEPALPPPPEPEPAPEPEAEPTDEATETAQPRGEGRDGRRQPLPARSEGEGTDRRPAVKQRGEVRGRLPANGNRRPPRRTDARGSWQRLTLWGLVAGVVLAGLVLAIANRGAITGLLGSGSTSSSTMGSQDQPKSADRITQSDSDGARRPATRNADGPQRAVLYEQTPGGGQPQAFQGTVTWKTETFDAGPGLPPDVGVRGIVQIPERGVTVTFLFRRNNDETLPASHTIEIGFKLPDDFPYGEAQSVPMVRMKQSETAQGAPLAGLSVRIDPTSFLVGLSNAPADKQRNLQLLQQRPWIDVPAVFANNRPLLFVFEKGPAGEQAFNDAFSAWGELIQQTPASQ